MPNDAFGNHVVALAVGGSAVSTSNPLLASTLVSGTEVVIANAVTLPTGANGQMWGSAAVAPTQRPKAIYVLITTALVFASGQPTIRLYASRIAQAAVSGVGATSGLALSTAYLSAALTITSAAQTAIPLNTLLRISSSNAAYGVGAAAQCVLGAATGWGELDRWDAFIGVEFNWGGSFTSGALSVFMECGGV